MEFTIFTLELELQNLRCVEPAVFHFQNLGSRLRVGFQKLPDIGSNDKQKWWDVTYLNVLEVALLCRILQMYRILLPDF